MRRSIILLLITVLLILSGCGCGDSDEPKTADFAITLPPGVSFSDVTDTTASIIIDSRAVGGIVLTDIRGRNMKRLDDKALFQYIDSCAPMPLMGEWISMFCENDGDPFIRVDLKITDTETNNIVDHTHFLYMKEEGVYDIWFDDAFVDDELRELMVDLALGS